MDQENRELPRGRSLRLSHLSEKARISHSSRSSSTTQVSTAMGPISLAGSCFFGLKALERRPFLCGVGVSAHGKRLTDSITSIILRKGLPEINAGDSSK